MKEHQQEEWKESWRDEYIKWISAFANSQGGRLVIGKNDRGQIIGIEDAKRLLEEIPNKVRDMLGIMVAVNLKTKAGRDYLEIEVDAYPCPVSCKGQYFIRSGSTKQELKGAALDRFILRKQGLHWDAVPAPGLSLRSLSSDAFGYFRRQATRSGRLSNEALRDNNEALIDKLRLREGKYLKRAAALLFHADPEVFVSGASIKIGYFRTDSDLVFHDIIQGNLFIQVEKTMDLLLTKYMEAAIRYEGIQRVEEYPYAPGALREALLNAVAHKDYGSSNPIQISVHPNRLYIWNAGQLPDGWTIERLKQKHPSIPYNPAIANAFFFAGLIEAWGRGIEKITAACETAGVPMPAFSHDETGLMVEFTPKPLPAIESGESGQKTPGKTLGKTPGKTPGKMSGKMSGKTPQVILRTLKEFPHASIPEIAKKIGKSTSAIERAIRKLRNTGCLTRIGPDKGGRWEVIDKP